LRPERSPLINQINKRQKKPKWCKNRQYRDTSNSGRKTQIEDKKKQTKNKQNTATRTPPKNPEMNIRTLEW